VHRHLERRGWTGLQRHHDLLSVEDAARPTCHGVEHVLLALQPGDDHRRREELVELARDALGPAGRDACPGLEERPPDRRRRGRGDVLDRRGVRLVERRGAAGEAGERPEGAAVVEQAHDDAGE